jgi:hypothetical protein
MAEGAAVTERARAEESADETERAEAVESALEQERTETATPERAGAAERPRYQLGYPRIEASTHHLWQAQQDGWPSYLPHEAWQALVSSQRTADQPRANSADHPAFGAAYVPNYAATPDAPSTTPINPPPGNRARR